MLIGSAPRLRFFSFLFLCTTYFIVGAMFLLQVASSIGESRCLEHTDCRRFDRGGDLGRSTTRVAASMYSVHNILVLCPCSLIY